MDIVTTTELRSKTAKLVEALKEGSDVILVHRSRIIAKIKPAKSEIKVFNFDRFKKLVSKLNLPLLTEKQIRQRYSDHLRKKYGKNIS